MTGPTHVNNPGGSGNRVSDSLDDVIGGAMGVIDYSAFLAAPANIRQDPSDTIYADDFDGNLCTQL
ncbi:hypothetical protein [Marinicella meishanensis]|uniref:hypothetical protein n=1 Tax=Marinicella meishanensis TaxID=2873263 RepID=UPI001CBE64B7|nr:hypothetical protein [Marinicella sp. NBU2979]